MRISVVLIEVRTVKKKSRPSINRFPSAQAFLFPFDFTKTTHVIFTKTTHEITNRSLRLKGASPACRLQLVRVFVWRFLDAVWNVVHD